MQKEEMQNAVLQLETDMGIAKESLSFDWEDGILRFEGNLPTWQLMVDFCYKAAKLPGVRNLVSHIRTPESIVGKEADLEVYKEKGVLEKADVVIIGGGVTG